MKNISLIRIFWTTLPLALTGLADTTATLNVGQSLSFDTFTVGSSGDMTFTGSSVTFASGVEAYNWGNMGVVLQPIEWRRALRSAKIWNE